jgi:hypothetical protein
MAGKVISTIWDGITVVAPAPPNDVRECLKDLGCGDEAKIKGTVRCSGTRLTADLGVVEVASKYLAVEQLM